MIKRKKKLTYTRKVSLPIKTDANLHLQQERSQPDPIMLLAAAAAVIDNNSYKGRLYERREIRLSSRHYGKSGYLDDSEERKKRKKKT
jgi:hypothetical protein